MLKRFMLNLLNYIKLCKRPKQVTKGMLMEHLQRKFNDEIDNFSEKDQLHLLYEKHEMEEGEETDDGYIMWDLNTMSDRIHMHKMANAVASWQFGMPIIVDMWYNQSHQDLNMLTMALKETIESNLDCKEPFYIHFTDIQIGSQSEKAVRQVLEQNCDYLQAFHVKSCVEMFPKSQLMYLTPYCGRYVTTLDMSKKSRICIIGGLMDDSQNRMSVRRIRHLAVEARCFYVGNRRSGLVKHGILSIADSLQVLHELQLGKSLRHSIKGIKLLENDERISKFKQLHYQGLFEY